MNPQQADQDHDLDDDRPVGRVLSRREVLALLGAGSAGLLAACSPAISPTVPPSLPGPNPTGTTAPTQEAATATPEEPPLPTESAPVVEEIPAPSCVVRPESTEGPLYVDVDLLRSDIREDRAGAPLDLTFVVGALADGACRPLEGALVEIWHCDAQGIYSGVDALGMSTQGAKWLRGGQYTGANGRVHFTTIYPGWYPGRAVHIHFKIAPTEKQLFTSQLYFPDDLSRLVFTRSPYDQRGTPNRTNENDGIFRQELLLAPEIAADGYAASFEIGIDMG